ncbi:ferritin-like protein [Kitasatospora aureofaciens]|uniref:ferritin-like domain-containing protein n=1 Tax=Kitasatospora aureofaciens TaxID=1894 RepID=UPI0038203BCF
MTSTSSISPLFTNPSDFKKGEIKTLANLRAHLKVAARVEMCTIPLYLYSAYSIKTKGYSQWSPGIGAFRTILGIAIEEMLHLCLARNLLIAVGGDITFCAADFIPEYPGVLPHHQGRLELHLERLSKDLVEKTFMPLELPEPRLMVSGEEEEHVEDYGTLGEFYRRIKEGFKLLDKKEKIDWSKCRKEFQYHRAYWNQNGGGTTLLVTDLDSALKALDTIIDQGEGADPEKGTVPRNPANPQPGLEEYTHFEKFKRIAAYIEGIGVVDGTREQKVKGGPEVPIVNIDSTLAVAVLARDPHVGDKYVQDSVRLRALMTLFNAAFTYTLALLDELYSRKVDDLRTDFTSRRYHLERTFIASMQGVLYPIADLLTRTPTGRTRMINGKEEPEYAGPAFEYYQYGVGIYGGTAMHAELVDLCRQAMTYFPQLGGEDGVQRQIGLLPELTPVGAAVLV